MFDDLLFKALMQKLSTVYPGKYISIGKSYDRYSTSQTIKEEITVYVENHFNKSFDDVTEMMEFLDPIICPEIIKIDLTHRTRMGRG